MSKSDVFENDLLKLILNGTPIAGLADNAASSPITTLYVSLHTADPGEAGTQSTSEATYTGYARTGVARTSGGWVIVNNVANPAAPINFPAATAGTNSCGFFAIGTLQTGAGKVLYSGSVSPAISVQTGVAPQLGTGTSVTEE